MRSSQRAPMEQQLDDRIRMILDRDDAELARLSARIAEQAHEIELLMDQLGDSRRDVQQLSGDLAQVRQVNESLVRRLEASGVTVIPPDSKLNKGEGI